MLTLFISDRQGHNYHPEKVSFLSRFFNKIRVELDKESDCRRSLNKVTLSLPTDKVFPLKIKKYVRKNSVSTDTAQPFPQGSRATVTSEIGVESLPSVIPK